MKPLALSTAVLALITPATALSAQADSPSAEAPSADPTAVLEQQPVASDTLHGVCDATPPA